MISLFFIYIKKMSGWIYLSLIPFFAIIYTFTPNDFYQSTVAQEGLLNHYKNTTRDFLEITIKEYINPNPSHVKIEECQTDSYDLNLIIANLKVNRRKIEPGDAVIAPSLTFTGIINYSCVRTSKSNSTSLEFGVVWNDFLGIDVSQYIYILGHDGNADEQRNDCDELKKYLRTVFHLGCALELHKNQAEQFKKLRQEYDKALSGNISSENGFWRMLYFSTVTVTTLGYGDIVPLTNRARLLVSLESILGIIFAGLFLNSIFTHRK